MRVLSLRDYNTRVVVIGTTLLGLAAGTIGCFTLLRKRALMGDALSHATLPGIGLAFMFSARGGRHRQIAAGAARRRGRSAGVLGLAAILGIRNFTRLKEDAALGIVLSVFFGAGVAVLGVVQRWGTGHAAGLETFIYGKTASMLAERRRSSSAAPRSACSSAACCSSRSYACSASTAPYAATRAGRSARWTW